MEENYSPDELRGKIKKYGIIEGVSEIIFTCSAIYFLFVIPLLIADGIINNEKYRECRKEGEKAEKRMDYSFKGSALTSILTGTGSLVFMFKKDKYKKRLEEIFNK